mgnify:CR=1 FL=1
MKNKKQEPDIPPAINPDIGIKLLQEQISKAEELLSKGQIEHGSHTAWKNTTREYLIKIFGSKSDNIDAVINASSDMGLSMNMSDYEHNQYLLSKVSNQIKILQSCIEQLNTQISIEQQTPAYSISPQKELDPLKVFIVHGHNSSAKEAVARTIETLGLSPVILHEEPNQGRTIIEKFTDCANVAFAIVLLTADDCLISATEKTPKPRARQNVILELGYFLGKLGRERVCILYENGVEIPSDYTGVVYTQLDTGGKWRFDLSKELKAAGYQIDANKLF